MKRTLVVALFACSLLNAEQIVYPTVVKSLYKSDTDKSVIGRVLPTSEVKILEKKGNRLKIQLEGFVQKGKEQAIYFKEGQRILVAAFKKGSNPEYKVLKAGDWSKVNAVVYMDEGDLEKELKPMMDKAAKLYSENCSICHSLHPVNEYNANQWPSVLKSMVDRTAIEKKDRFLVTEYLQKTTTKK